ncbi:hypothetical protein BASA81_000186 [Batrachochytrium salamandrivorans]|nr:hypothetical protein BASA81_000186 [Batrachochytrium salamandrivorans]
MSAFEGCVSLRVAEQRSREDRRERNHSKHQLTWVMSQQDSNTPDDDEEGEEADATAELTANLNLVVSSWSPEFLKELIHDNAGHAHFVLFLQAVFECSKPKSKGGLERLLVAFEATAQALADKPVVRREDVVAELLQQTKLIPERSLAMVTERVPGHRLGGAPAGAAANPDHQCSANLALQDLDGKQFKFLVVRQLCSSKTITEHTLPPLLVALKDLCHNLERDDAKLSALVFERMERNVCAWLKKVRPSQHLGRIALHFFGLSRYFASKDRACRYLMEDFFEQPEEQVPLVVFGQVLMNFSLVCAQDAELGKAFLRELETVPLTRTSLAFLLSLSRIKRFEEASFDLFLRKSKGKAGKPQSPQHQQLLENNLMQLCDDIAACRASSSWELLLPCLVKASTKLADSETTLLPHPNLDLSSNGGVGVRVLAHCFRVHALCRIDLLNEVFKRSLCCPLQQVLPFTRMLFLLMRAEDTNRIILSDYAQLVKDLVSMLPNCQPRVAHGLLRAVFTPHPTASSSSSSSKHKREMQTIRDHSMVVFRKTLFLREPKPRFVAMFGILCLFRQEEDEDALNCLKRCLSQQCEIRAALYAGLLVLPSVCAELIVLSSHFNALLVPRKDGEDVAPLRFQQCLDTNGRIAEPLAGLLQCAIHGGFDPTELIARFCTGSLASFSLDKSCGFDSCVTGGAGNRSTASLVIECCEVLINHLVERRLGTQEEIAKLWRLQRAVRRLVAGNTTGLVSAPKRSKKTKPQKKSLEGAENGDEEEDECGEDGGRLVDAPLPDEGSWLSDRALLMLFAQSQTVAVDSMMQVSPANANELAGLQTRSGFHIYLLQCVKLRLAAVGKLCQTQPAVQSPFASAKLAAATGTGATMMEESGGAYTQDMARRCAGGSEMDVTGFFTHLGPLLLKALPRYEKLQGLIQADISTAAAATVAEKEEPKKKRKVAASSAAATSSSSTAENDGLKLREQAIECLKDLVVCLSKSSSPSPASSEAFAQVITQTFSLQTPAAAKQNVFHLAGIQLFEIVRKLFTQHRLGAALQAFDTYCLLVTRAISWLGEEDKSDAQDTVMDHHVSLCKQLLGEFELKSGAHVKLLVKFYLELNTKLCKGNLSLICSELASHVMLNSSQDHGLKMIVHARLPTLQVLVGHICHAMDELELGFAQVDTCKSTLIQLDEASELFTVFLQRAQDGEAEAFDLDPELLLKAVIKYYKLLAKLFKALVAAKQPVTECAGDVGRLVQKVAKHLSPLVDERLKDLQSGSRASAPAEDSEAPCKPKSRAKKPASSSASRNKLVPEVVFCLEQYEVMVLKASKGCQGSLSALGRFVRRTTARDFKVDLEKLKTALGEQEDEEQEEEEEEA